MCRPVRSSPRPVCGVTTSLDCSVRRPAGPVRGCAYEPAKACTWWYPGRRSPATSVLFVLPWGGHWIIGTTDTDWSLDRAHPAASARDIVYLLEQLNGWLDRPVRPEDIEGVYAGLRPLLSGEDEQTSALSREHAVVEPMLGIMVVAGGKYTTYRVMAADVIDRVVRRLGPFGGDPPPASHTDRLPLLGADGYPAMWSNRADIARRP